MAENGSPRGVIFARWIIGALGGIFLLIGAGLLVSSYNFYNNALYATGTVVSVEVNNSSDGTTYRPTLRYLDYRGQKQRGTTFLSSSGYDFEVGEKMEILYDMRDPTSIRINNWLELWGLGAIFATVGGVVVLGAMVIGRGKGRKRAPQDRIAGGSRAPAPAGKNMRRTIKAEKVKPAHVMEHNTPPIKPRALDRSPTVRRRR